MYTGWLNDMAAGAKAAVTAFDWIGLILICFVLPAVITPLLHKCMLKMGWVREGDLALN